MLKVFSLIKRRDDLSLDETAAVTDAAGREIIQQQKAAMERRKEMEQRHREQMRMRFQRMENRLAEERELVQAGNPILVLGAKDKGFIVRTGLADREIVQVKLGDEAQIRAELGPDAIILSSKEVQQGGRLLRLFNRPVLEVMAAAEQPPACQATRHDCERTAEHVPMRDH